MSAVQMWVGGEEEKGEVEKKERVGETRREMRHWNCLISLGDVPTSSLKSVLLGQLEMLILPQNMLRQS